MVLLFPYVNGFSYGTKHTQFQCPCAGRELERSLVSYCTIVNQEPSMVQVMPQLMLLIHYGWKGWKRMQVSGNSPHSQASMPYGFI